jgi:two-component system, chemotaxis family, chemotaxis protein CheY
MIKLRATQMHQAQPRNLAILAGASGGRLKFFFKTSEKRSDPIIFFWRKAMHTLIVEDDPVSSKFLCKLLSTFGCCDTAHGGRQAVEIFRRSLDQYEPYDLICMDIMMPEINGHEALYRIREIEKQARIPAADEVKVIITTALNGPQDVADALFKGGACAYFIKPLKVDDFIHELKNFKLIPE